MSNAIDDVIRERRNQIERHGYIAEHDDAHTDFEMAMAGAKYAEFAASRQVSDESYCQIGPPLNWPWDDKYWSPKNPRRDLIKAAALIIAEIERLDRLSV